jgi:uncharacterized membrane protein
MAKGESAEKRIGQLIERIDHLETILRAQSGRLHAIEQKLDIAPPPEPARPPESIAGTTREPVRAPASAKRRGDLEERVGGSWFNRIGMLAIAIGVAFFLKYAFENEWIGPGGRILIGIIIGAGFLIAGERMRARYAAYAHGLSGGGILILYISFYAAFSFYQMIAQSVAFASMAAVTVLAAFLAARYNAVAIAILGLVGGFLTPPLLGTKHPNEVGLFGYVTLLDAGVLALSYSKQWRSLNYLSFAATALTAIGWILFAPYTPDALWVTIFFLTIFFAVFALVPVLYNVVNRRPSIWPDLTLVFLNAVFYFAASYELLEEKYEAYLGLFALMVAAFYLGLGFFTYNRDREDRLLVYTFLGLAILFLVLAVPIQLRQHWVTMGWAIEGAVLVWVGLRANDRTSRFAALAVFVVAALYWALIDAPERGHSHGLLVSHRAFSGFVLIIALSAAAWLYERNREKVGEREHKLFGGSYVIAANFMAVALFSLEAVDYFDRTKQGGQFGSDEFAGLENKKQLTLSALWTVYGTVVMFAGTLMRSLMLRWMALALLSVTIVKVFLVDLASLKGVYRIISFVALGAILLIVSFLYTRSRQRAAQSDDLEAPATD